MAVVVRQEDRNFYKVHRLLLPDGSQFIFNKKGDTAERAGQENNLDLSPADNVSKGSIPQTYKKSQEKLSDRITASMSDSERAKILRNKTITNIPIVKEIPDIVIQKIENISSWEDFNNLFGRDKRNLIKKLAQEFGVFKEYSNSDINLSFEFSKNNYRESYGKQKRNYESFAKMFSVFDQVIENAIGIEVHNRNNENYKPDATLNNVYVLISAFEDEDSIIPVKLEVKEFEDKKNTLYVAISLQAIKKTEVSKQGTTENGVAQNSRSATISISDLLKIVNSTHQSILLEDVLEHLGEQRNLKGSYSEIRQGTVLGKTGDGSMSLKLAVELNDINEKSPPKRTFYLNILFPLVSIPTNKGKFLKVNFFIDSQPKSSKAITSHSVILRLARAPAPPIAQR